MASLQEVVEDNPDSRGPLKLPNDGYLLRLMCEHMPVALAIFDRDLNYLALSRQWREDFGLGNGDYIGECQYDVMPETRLHWTHRFERCLIGETLSSPGAVLVRKDGERQSVSWELRPWMDDAGRIGGVVMITRTLANDEAKQSARLRDIAMDSALSPLAMLNVKGEITYANQAFAELVGADGPKEVTGIRGDEFWRPQEDGTDVWTTLIASGKWIGTTDLRRFDGSIRSVQITANLIHDEKQKTRGVIASLVDITEQKRTEAALSETERRLATVIESLPGGVVFRCRHDACLTMELLSGSTKDLFGFPAEAVIGNRKVSFSSLIFSDDQARVHREIGDALADGRSFHVIYRIRTKDGALKWMLQQGNPLFSDDGGVDALEGVIIDITAQVTAEHTIRQEKERAEQYLDVAASIILALDQRGRVTLFNRKGMEVCGYSEQELLGKNWFDVMHLPENRLEAKSEFHQMIRQDTDDPIYLESEIRTKNGEQKFIGWTLNRIRDERGDVNGLLGSGEDLTDRRDMERQLLQAQKMQAVGELTGGLAHDFNNLLMAVQGNIEFLFDQVGDNPDHARYIEAAQKAVQRGADLTQRLLAFSRKQLLHPAVTEVNQLIEDMTELLSRTLGRNISIETRLAQELDAAMVDPAQLENALLNLAINARDAMSDGGRLVIESGNRTVSDHADHQASGLKPGRYVMITVTDTGIGMPEEVVDRAFEPFFTTKDAHKGSGLGLSMTYGFVKQSGGHILIQSEQGRGTCVRLYLPVAEAKREEFKGHERSAGAVRRGRETILVVDDDEEVRSLITRNLSSLGYHVIPCDCARTALEQVASGHIPQLLISDIMQPGGMNGVELAQLTKEYIPGCRVLLISGYSDKALNEEGHSNVPFEVLRKPFNRQDLIDRVSRLLDGYAYRSYGPNGGPTPFAAAE